MNFNDPSGRSLSSLVKAMGLVFGDIGTSPIYTLTVIFVLTPPTPQNVVDLQLIVKNRFHLK
jgi:KUP system potassium uptake protein